MNDPSLPELPAEGQLGSHTPPRHGSSKQTLGGSSIYRLCEEIIALRETNSRQHKLYEQALVKSRDTLQSAFNSFAADTQRAYQQLRQELHGEKRISLALLNELLELGFDLERIAAGRPPKDDGEALGHWADAIEVEVRKARSALSRHGIQRYDAVIGSAYHPAFHERVGSRRMEGMDPLRVAEQREHGYASQQPEFILRRPKVIVSE
ncbi:MAG TPA: nucleotide exchange factor GrpE [Gemmataceae bacterium]|nr:nucleotide exchange factor GrpE [Gemmataceae bacterium]